MGSICKQHHRSSKSSFETNLKPFQSLNSKCAASKHYSLSIWSKRTHDEKLPVISPSPTCKISLEPQTLPPSRYPEYHVPFSGVLKLSRTYLHNLESLLMIIHNPIPKIKEALHKIKKELKFSATFHSESSLDTFYSGSSPKSSHPSS